MIYICIPVHNNVSFTLSCLGSLETQTHREHQTILCDDGSTDGTWKRVNEEYPKTWLIKGNGSLWWTGGTNACVKRALEVAQKGDFVFTLNNDTELLPTTLGRLCETSGQNSRSIVGAVNVFYKEPNLIEPSAYRIKGGLFFPRIHNRINEWAEELNTDSGVTEVDSLSGKGALIPIELFQELGLYNAERLPHYHADTELVFRAKRNGYRVYLDYKAKVLSHQEHSGLGTVTSNPSFKGFVKSFSSQKSANHYQSLKNYCELLYGKSYKSYLAIYLAKIVLGFVKRYLVVRS